MMSGKLALVVSEPVEHTKLFIYYVLVDGNTISCMEEHLKDPERQQEIKIYEEYTD